MGPYQTLRAETWWTLLQITFRVFFMSRNPGNHKNRSKKYRDVLFLRKKGPCQEAGMPHPSLYRSKMSPLTFPTQWNAQTHVFIHFLNKTWRGENHVGKNTKKNINCENLQFVNHSWSCLFGFGTTIPFKSAWVKFKSSWSVEAIACWDSTDGRGC